MCVCVWGGGGSVHFGCDEHAIGNVPEGHDSFTAWVTAGTISPEQSNKRDV